MPDRPVIVHATLTGRQRWIVRNERREAVEADTFALAPAAFVFDDGLYAAQERRAQRHGAGGRNLHAWVEGIPLDPEGIDHEGVEVTYTPTGFVTSEGDGITHAAAALFLPDRRLLAVDPT